MIFFLSSETRIRIYRSLLKENYIQKCVRYAYITYTHNYCTAAFLSPFSSLLLLLPHIITEIIIKLYFDRRVASSATCHCHVPRPVYVSSCYQLFCEIYNAPGCFYLFIHKGIVYTSKFSDLLLHISRFIIA